MRTKTVEIAIYELNQKFSSNIFKPTEFQRKADAWGTKQQKSLIYSILEDYYIPALLFSGNQILDGLQRMTCINQFIDNKFYITLKDSKKDHLTNNFYFEDLAPVQKEKILNRKLIIVDLTDDSGGDLTPQEQKELFYRINTNSIKLNKAETIFTMCPSQNRKVFIDITLQNKDLENLANNKKGKRFSLEALLLWCLTVVYYRATGVMDSTSKASIRNMQKRFINYDFPDSELKEFTDKSKKTISLMNNILDSVIPPSKFKVIFSAVFVCIYEHLDSYNAFLQNKQEIKKKLLDVFQKLIDNQQIGGIHYDSYFYFKQRIAEVMSVLAKYKVDDKRFLTVKEKIKLYFENAIKNGGSVTCCECKKVITNWHDINVDHIYAHTKGGKSTIDNSQILCEKCNKKKGKR